MLIIMQISDLGYLWPFSRNRQNYLKTQPMNLAGKFLRNSFSLGNIVTISSLSKTNKIAKKVVWTNQKRGFLTLSTEFIIARNGTQEKQYARVQYVRYVDRNST